jgi:hypothetical protein
MMVLVQLFNNTISQLYAKKKLLQILMQIHCQAFQMMHDITQSSSEINDEEELSKSSTSAICGFDSTNLNLGKGTTAQIMSFTAHSPSNNIWIEYTDEKARERGNIIKTFTN